MNTILSIIIMAVMAFIGYMLFEFEGAILFALISGIGCVIQAINHKPTDSETE